MPLWSAIEVWHLASVCVCVCVRKCLCLCVCLSVFVRRASISSQHPLIPIVCGTGITLSGGQKARVSLARAMYSQANV